MRKSSLRITHYPPPPRASQQWELSGANMPANTQDTEIVRSKRYKEDVKKRPEKAVPIDAAVDIVKSFKATKFDQSVELIVNLGIDPKQADQMIRGSLSLPHGVG